MHRLRRWISLVVAGGGAVASLALAPTAPASTATLWACHGPAGQPLGVGALTASASGDGVASTYAGGCDAAGDLSAGGVRASFSRTDPSGGAYAIWRVAVPPAVELRSVSLTRRTFGIGTAETGSPQDYFAETSSGVLESASLPDAGSVALDGVLTADPASGEYVQMRVRCGLGGGDRCPAGPGGLVGADVGAIAMRVEDDDDPAGAVGGLRDPADGTLTLTVLATDAGLGLRSLTAQLDGTTVDAIDLGGSACADLSPTDPAIDLPLDETCPDVVTDAVLRVDTTSVPDGPHRLVVVATDAAGNTTALADEELDVRNSPVASSPTATLLVGTGGIPAAGAAPATGPGTSAADPCPSPRLSMALTQRPLRRRRGVPVLRALRRYRFRGQLTCLLGGRRVPAPIGLPVDVLNVVRRVTLVKTGMTVRGQGRLTAILAYRSTRTIVFRYRALDGTVTQVRIRILVRRRR